MFIGLRPRTLGNLLVVRDYNPIHPSSRQCTDTIDCNMLNHSVSIFKYKENMEMLHKCGILPCFCRSTTSFWIPTFPCSFCVLCQLDTETVKHLSLNTFLKLNSTHFPLLSCCSTTSSFFSLLHFSYQGYDEFQTLVNDLSVGLL